MGPYMEFGIIEHFDKNKDYGIYEPEKYNCISIEDNWMNLLYKPLLIMKTYFGDFSKPMTSFSRWGVTLIPPESLDIFYDTVVSLPQFHSSEEFADLATIIYDAQQKDKYVIHFGV